jgi:hypothetical protein
VGLEALWEAKTRSVKVLGGLGTFTDEPQETKLKLATTSATVKSADLFKR